LLAGRKFRTLNLMDGFTRYAPRIEVDTSLPGQRVVRVLEDRKRRGPGQLFLPAGETCCDGDSVTLRLGASGDSERRSSPASRASSGRPTIYLELVQCQPQRAHFGFLSVRRSKTCRPSATCCSATCSRSCASSVKRTALVFRPLTCAGVRQTLPPHVSLVVSTTEIPMGLQAASCRGCRHGR
jgi:hypothetical protein